MRTLVTFGLWLVYLALSANLELNNLVVGLLIAVGVAALLPLPREKANWRRAPEAFWAGLRYAWIVATDVVSGGLQVARLTLDPKLPVEPGIVAIPSGTESELATALSAHAITISPGEMVVEIGEDGVMYTHALEVSQARNYADQAQRLRRELLQKILP